MKRDFDRCGQSQDTLLPKFPLAFNFYKKFDPLHLQDLTDVQYNEIIEGITKLKSAYNSIEEGAPITGYFSFSKLVELSKLTPKK